MELPPSSLSIAPQVVSRRPCRNHLHNPACRVTIRPHETRNASCPAPVKVHRKPGGKRFWPHRLPQTAPEHTETAELRAPKSNWNQIKTAKSHYKQVEKIFSKSLGPGDRAFEPHYSDQNPSEIVDFRGVFLILCLVQNKHSFRGVYEVSETMLIFVGTK